VALSLSKAEWDTPSELIDDYLGSNRRFGDGYPHVTLYDLVVILGPNITPVPLNPRKV